MCICNPETGRILDGLTCKCNTVNGFTISGTHGCDCDIQNNYALKVDNGIATCQCD